MGIRLGWLLGGVLCAQVAQAQWSATITGTTDYDFRGASQTSGDEALQGSVDFESGLFYGSLWGSNVDFGDDVDGSIEIDLSAGLAGETERGIDWDVGAVYYFYPGSNEDVQNETEALAEYGEFYAGGGYGPVQARLWWSPSYLDESETAYYAEINAAVDLPADFVFNLHYGYSFGDYFDELENALGNPASDIFDPDFDGDDAEYADISFGVARAFGRVDTELKVVTTNTDDYFEVDRGPGRNDTRVIFSIGTTFPWSDE